MVDLDSQDIREYSRRYNRGVYNLKRAVELELPKTALLPLNSRFWVDTDGNIEFLDVHERFESTDLYFRAIFGVRRPVAW